ncbi:MAG: hypothetical protein KDC92_12725, partial [Bacteroidetes bacterium]|nr:hypothetical protein [Bacteroidota bacterium]
MVRVFCGSLLMIALLFSSNKASAQICGSNTPTFTIDLTGNPDSVWTSTNIARQDTCCGAAAPDRCIRFLLTLDSGAYGIKLDLIKGALPTGALYYQVSCGTKVPIGEVLCLSGSGPHEITFCKPGNNKNTYQITSVAKPDISDNIVVSEACNGRLYAEGFEDSTIRWTSTPYDSTHNSYLSCTQGCDTTYVNATYPFPRYVSYKVCGSAEGCVSIRYCDSATVEFVTEIEVDIQPDSPKVCYGSATATLTAVPIGGKAPYSFLWSTGDTTRQIQGYPDSTYWVQMNDSLNCGLSFDTVYVDSFSLPILADAGVDTILCFPDSIITLNGQIQAATGGKWILGTGNYALGDTQLTTNYRPSNSEFSNGYVDLGLITTGNFDCPGDTDYVRYSFYQSPVATISGPDTVCLNDDEIYTTTFGSTNTYNWSIQNGQILTSTPFSNSINALITNAANTEISLNVVDGNGCDASDTQQVYTFPSAPFSISGPDSVCQNSNATYGINGFEANAFYTWQISGGSQTISLLDSTGILWGNGQQGTIILIRESSNGCFDTVSKQVILVQAPPFPIITGPDTLCELTNGQLYYTTQFHSISWSISVVTTNSQLNNDSIFVNADTTTGIAIITVEIENITGCKSSSPKFIKVATRPDSVIYGPDTICETSYGVEYAASAGTQHSWSLTNINMASGAGTDSISVNFPIQQINHQLDVEITNAFGCKSNASKSVVVNTRPDSFIYGPDSICETTYGV